MNIKKSSVTILICVLFIVSACRKDDPSDGVTKNPANNIDSMSGSDSILYSGYFSFNDEAWHLKNTFTWKKDGGGGYYELFANKIKDTIIELRGKQIKIYKIQVAYMIDIQNGKYVVDSGVLNKYFTELHDTLWEWIPPIYLSKVLTRKDIFDSPNVDDKPIQIHEKNFGSSTYNKARTIWGVSLASRNLLPSGLEVAYSQSYFITFDYIVDGDTIDLRFEK
jgi:hypothetical protein